MSYQYYVQEEYDLSLLAMFEWVTFQNEAEDTANFVFSEPMVTDTILVRNRSILLNEQTSLWLSPERTEAIRFANTVNYPSGNFTIGTWLRPYENTGAAYRGVLEFGPLRIAVVNVGATTFDVRLEVDASSHNITLDISDDGYNVMVVRDGNNYTLYVDNVSITTLTVAALDFSTADMLIGHATGWTTDPQAELDVQGVTLFPVALTQQQRDDVWSVANTNAIVRTVTADTKIDITSEYVRVLQTEWHSILV